MLLINKDNVRALQRMVPNSVDSVVTDPPYGLSFMGKTWDYSVPSVDFWKEVYRVLKPGGHVLSFGGTRTYHRMAVNIEDAGFEIRDQIQWLYGSGFPKSHNISKGIDRRFGITRKAEPLVRCDGRTQSNKDGGGSFQASEKYEHHPLGEKSHELAKKWDGFGSALKPAVEPIVMARKPLSEKNIVENVLRWGVGGINIDGCKIGTEQRTNTSASAIFGSTMKIGPSSETIGRFPANILFSHEPDCLHVHKDGSTEYMCIDDCAVKILNLQSGPCKTGDINNKGPQSGFSNSKVYGTSKGIIGKYKSDEPTGASRFFYCSKPSKREKETGWDEGHPTTKPVDLMRYLLRLVTPPGGTILDPFMGSGTTGIAAQKEGFYFVGMEIDIEYFQIAKKRIEKNSPSKGESL